MKSQLFRLPGCLLSALTIGWLFAPATLTGAPKLQITEKLKQGLPVKIACFGDSVTGVYYHTGGRRAWCDLVGIALKQAYSSARVEMINAGVSGNDTFAALKRMEADLLSRGPQLVLVMFGLNDVVRVPIETYRANLTEIVSRSRERGAEVLLMTTNSIYSDDPRRPPLRVAEYAQIVREVGGSLQVPVADCYRAFEEVRAVSRYGWVRLMSDAIHPNMRGHSVFAEEVVWTLSGKRISLGDLPPLEPALPRVLSQFKARQPIRVVAMKPYDDVVEPALKKALPGVEVRIMPWNVEAKSLAAIESQAKEIGWWRFLNNKAENEKPDLVVVAVPASALAPDDEGFYRSYTWILNWSLSFGTPGWDCLAVLPSVTSLEQGQGGQAAERLAVDVVRGQDIPWLQRSRGDSTSADQLVAQWFGSLVGKSK